MKTKTTKKKTQPKLPKNSLKATVQAIDAGLRKRIVAFVATQFDAKPRENLFGQRVIQYASEEEVVEHVCATEPALVAFFDDELVEGTVQRLLRKLCSEDVLCEADGLCGYPSYVPYDRFEEAVAASEAARRAKAKKTPRTP